MKKIAVIALSMALFACANNPETQPEPQQKKPNIVDGKEQCAVASDCMSETAICVKPEAADYGFCLG